MDIDNLLCFWDFQEPEGSPRVAKGPFPYGLRENNGPIARIEGGHFGAYAVRLRPGQWFYIPRDQCPALGLGGPEATWPLAGAARPLLSPPFAVIEPPLDRPVRGCPVYPPAALRYPSLRSSTMCRKGRHSS